MSDSTKRRIKCKLCGERVTQWWSYFNNIMLHCYVCNLGLHSGPIPWGINKKEIPKIKLKMLKQWELGKRNTQENLTLVTMW